MKNLLKKSLTLADLAWVKHIGNILDNGSDVITRGMQCKEITGITYSCPMWDCVITVPQRELNYKFMAAEAYWILRGDNTVAGIAPYNRHISKFSDNGETFFGAYGPKIMNQIDYVVKTLANDLNTRQAVLTIWRENPPQTKDVPCTVSMVFQVRNGLLNCHTFMRSSDAWLGLPYDVFNFSMVSAYVLAILRNKYNFEFLQLGDLHITAVSAHLYSTDLNKALSIVQHIRKEHPVVLSKYLPIDKLSTTVGIIRLLDEIRESEPGYDVRWWE